MTDSGTEHRQKKERFLAMLQPVAGSLERYALAMTRSADDANDLVNETLLQAFLRFDSIREPRAFLSYLLSIASRIQKRHNWRRRRSASLSHEHASVIECRTISPELSADIIFLLDALSRLPERQREALALHHLSGFSLHEVQEIQGGTLTALKVRLHRARKNIGKLLGIRETLPSGPPHLGEESPTSTFDRPSFEAPSIQ